MLADIDYINRALDLAERGRGTTSPNPMVGAVVVREDGTIVGQGYHEEAGGPHAEVRALDEAGDLSRRASLFVTLEPCAHVGLTGPCVERVAAAGITRVVASSEDPNPLVAGRGFTFLRQHGIEVVVGAGRERAARLFSTLEAGPVIIVTTPDSLSRNPARARELERVGAHVEPIKGSDLQSALRRLAEKQIVSLVLEGGPTLHRAAASEGVVDAVHLYVAPDPVGNRGVPWLDSGEL